MNSKILLIFIVLSFIGIFQCKVSKQHKADPVPEIRTTWNKITLGEKCTAACALEVVGRPCGLVDVSCCAGQCLSELFGAKQTCKGFRIPIKC